MRLEKNMFEGGLKGAEECFADLKARTDLPLVRAINFNFVTAAFFEQCLDSATGEHGRVAVAAEMTEHDTLDFSRQQLFDDARRGDIGKMSVPRLNALFHRPRPMWIVLQHFFVVVRLDDQRLHFTQALDQHLGGITKIGNESEATRASVKSETNRIYRVMRHRERLHGDITNRKLRAGAEDAPVTVPA